MVGSGWYKGPREGAGLLSKGKAVLWGQRDQVLLLAQPIADLVAFVMLGEHLDASEPQYPYL